MRGISNGFFLVGAVPSEERSTSKTEELNKLKKQEQKVQRQEIRKTQDQPEYAKDENRGMSQLLGDKR